MITRQPDYNRNFRCIGGACPDTCCRDWEIVPDEDALADYRNAPSLLRELIAANLAESEEGEPCFRLREDGFCALLTEDGLCPIQRDWGEEHLCGHCKAYPRFTEEYGCLTETALAVSCPEAARLLLECERFVLVGHNDGKADQPFDGVDGELLAGLEVTRARALAALEEEGVSLWQRLARVLALADDGQDCIDFGAYEEMVGSEVFEVEAEKPTSRRMTAAKLMKTCAELECLRPSWIQRLEQGSDALFAMKKDYTDLCRRFEQANPNWERHLTNLAGYLVFRHWHKTVNDDNLYGRAALTAASCLLVYHLCLLTWKEKGALFPAEEALIWSAFSREIEHLEENLDALTEILFDTAEWPLLSALCTDPTEKN